MVSMDGRCHTSTTTAVRRTDRRNAKQLIMPFDPAHLVLLFSN
jgi:hypothetical protein